VSRLSASGFDDRVAVPCELVWYKDRPLIGFAEVGGDELKRPFWFQTVKRRQLVALQPLDDPQEAQCPPDGMIYTVGRSGSTLLSALLSVLPGVYALREPELYRELLGGGRGTAADRVRWLRNLTAIYRSALAGRARHLVIKWKPFFVFFHAEISAAFPGVPSIFVYRDPIEVALSFCDHPPLMNQSFAMEWFPDDLRPAEAVPLEARRRADFAVRVIAAIYDAMAEAPEIRMLDYRALPQAAWSNVAPFFGLEVDDGCRRQMAELARYDPKAVPEKKEFRNDCRDKQDRAGADLRELVRRLAQPRFERLGEIRPL
jgi:hypothetical protein